MALSFFLKTWHYIIMESNRATTRVSFTLVQSITKLFTSLITRVFVVTKLWILLDNCQQLGGEERRGDGDGVATRGLGVWGDKLSGWEVARVKRWWS